MKASFFFVGGQWRMLVKLNDGGQWRILVKLNDGGQWRMLVNVYFFS